MDPFLIALTLMVVAFVGGLLIGIGWCSCECEEDEWDEDATFTTSYPRRER